MSFIIKGIDMPKDGKALHMRVQSDGAVRYLIEGDDPVHIIDGAQAIQTPKDHGRVIDGDAFIRHLQDIFCDKCGQHKKYGGVVCHKCYINDVILEYGDAPTILEAEV